MVSANGQKGNDGLYWYYRCTRKNVKCSEPYTQEKLVIAQCVQIVKPLAISTEDANALRAIIDKETQQDGRIA
jgi:hypothetical protein